MFNFNIVKILNLSLKLVLSVTCLSYGDLFQRLPASFMFLSAFRFRQDENESLKQPPEKSKCLMLDIFSTLLFPSPVRRWGLGIFSQSCSAVLWRVTMESKCQIFPTGLNVVLLV